MLDKTPIRGRDADDRPASRVPYSAPNASSWYQAPSSSRARMASDPFRNARQAILAVPAGTAGHGCGCIDMMTRFCGREQEQGKTSAAPGL